MKPFSRRNFFKLCGAYVTALTSLRPHCITGDNVIEALQFSEVDA